VVKKTFHYENDLTREAEVDLLLGFLDDFPVRGNKWFKMKYNLAEYREGQYDALLTFGGNYSNHLFAAARAGNIYGFDTVGVVRGVEPQLYNGTLSACRDYGMKLHFVSRAEYAQKNDEKFRDSLSQKFGNVYFLPEGGSNVFAVKGTSEIYDYFEEKFDFVCLSAGTGGTAAGIALAGEEKNFRTEVFSSLKNGIFLQKDIHNLAENYMRAFFQKNTGLELNNLHLHTRFDFGGYAKCPPELTYFIENFYSETNILTEKIYTAKMLSGVLTLLREKYFPAGSKILVLMTKGNERSDF
jgi:1-aminocyclopropane-1-carboxylate deaminase